MHFGGANQRKNIPAGMLFEHKKYALKLHQSKTGYGFGVFQTARCKDGNLQMLPDEKHSERAVKLSVFYFQSSTFDSVFGMRLQSKIAMANLWNRKTNFLH